MQNGRAGRNGRHLMNERRISLKSLSLGGLFVGCLLVSAFVTPQQPRLCGAPAVQAAAPQPAAPGAPQVPVFTSPEVRADRRVTFRVLAPAAQKVELRSPGDIPGVGGRGVAPPQLTKNSDGVWE